VNNNCFPWNGFSLYAYVQQKHWSVGLFRYYEIKQIPNFILALPVLVLSTCGVVRWIQDSLHRLKVRMAESFSSTLVCVCQWAVEALGASAIPSLRHARDDENAKKHAAMECSRLEETGSLASLLGSTALSYYAILFEFVLVGSFLAHVQISTRLISSSCPAFYWFVVVLFLRDNSTSQITSQSHESWRKEHGHNNISLGWILYFYFAFYNLLGVIMHVNFLPWT
jgi:phosphatidylinositol glycan class V